MTRVPYASLRRFLAALIPLAALGLVACEDDPVSPIETLPRDLSVQEQEVIRGSNAFAFELLREAHGSEEWPNVFLSPLSASMALGMTLNGTAEETRDQMAEVLGFQGMDEAGINEAYRDLIGLLLELDPRVRFELGNSVWARTGIPFHDAFYDRVESYFGAEARELDFDDPTAPGVINDWVREATAGRITELIDQIEETAIMFLINAVYFQGDWAESFDPSRTRPRPFHRAEGGTSEVPLMSLQSAFRSFRTETASGVELPYGGGAFTAVGVLPRPEHSLAEVVGELDTGVWASWMEELDAAPEQEMLVELPRFELEYERVLNPDLQAMGMTDAFDEVRADFTRLTPLDEPAGAGPPWVAITEVKQKTFLKVDEEGTEAAAATSVEIGVTSAPPSFTFDRPFLFAIRERLSGTLLFLGVIGDPTAG